jgi:hypothetical protein
MQNSLASQALELLRQHGKPELKQLWMVGVSGFDLQAQLSCDFFEFVVHVRPSLAFVRKRASASGA